MGPVSWLAMTTLAVTTPEGGPSRLPNWPQAARELLGLLIAFGAIPRRISGLVLLVIEGVTFLLVREGFARALLVAAMLMDLVSLGIFALHLARAARYQCRHLPAMLRGALGRPLRFSQGRAPKRSSTAAPRIGRVDEAPSCRNSGVGTGA
jgi:hypothetical protein